MATKHGLGADPLDALTGDDPSVGSVGSVGKRRPAKRRIEPVKLDGEVVDQVRAAVWWFMHNGQPTATLKALAERALLTEVQRLADEHNGGEPFPSVGALPRGGRIHQE